MITPESLNIAALPSLPLSDPMIRISATIPKAVLEQLRQVSKQERRSMSAQLTLILEEALELRNQKAIAPVTP